MRVQRKRTHGRAPMAALERALGRLDTERELVEGERARHRTARGEQVEEWLISAQNHW